MKKSSKLVLTAVMVFFALMAFNSNCVLADDAVELKILDKTKSINRRTKTLENIINTQVLPRLGSVSKTGQTTSYATGDDGDLQMGTAWPKPRFTKNGDGTVTDNLTGLIWVKRAGCFLGVRTWDEALAACNGLADPDCGLTDGSIAGDWRLPNRKELESLLDLNEPYPTLPSGHPFKGVASQSYWSSTTCVNVSDYAWAVSMNSASVDRMPKFYTFYVWPVRGPQ